MNDYEQLTPTEGSLPPPLDPNNPLPPPSDLPPSKNSPLGQGTQNEQGNEYEALGNPTPDEFVSPPDLSKPTPQKLRKAGKRFLKIKKKKIKKTTKRKRAEDNEGSTEGDGAKQRAFCTINCICCTFIALIFTVLVFAAALVILQLTTSVVWIPEINEFYNKTIKGMFK